MSLFSKICETHNIQPAPEDNIRGAIIKFSAPLTFYLDRFCDLGIIV